MSTKIINQKILLLTIDYIYPSLNRKDLSDLSKINDKNNFKYKHKSPIVLKPIQSIYLYIEGESARQL